MLKSLIILFLLGLPFTSNATEIPDFIKPGNQYLAKGSGTQLIEVVKIDHDWLYIKIFPQEEDAAPRYAWIHIHSDFLQAIVACDDEHLDDELKSECQSR